MNQALGAAVRYGTKKISGKYKSNAQRTATRNKFKHRYRYKRDRNGNIKQYYKVEGMAGGTTHTTTRMIVKKTPKEQKFLRKLFKENPKKIKYINRFGFAWMGASAASKVIWYSVTHLKFNNICTYMKTRPTLPSQGVGQVSILANDDDSYANTPDQYVYLGKCTFSYELYNPTNYIMTIYIYDLICRHDTPYAIGYSNVSDDNSSAPENCMRRSGDNIQDDSTNPTWVVGDSTYENGTYYNMLGTKPTDYHLFNTLWKVKGMRKIVLPPTSSHHHIVVYNPKKKITQASLFYPREGYSATSKNGIAGITQATLFGFQGQVAVEDNTNSDLPTENVGTKAVGTLPGKLIVSCVKKVNCWYGDPVQGQIMVQDNDLKTAWTKPTIFTDLVEVQASSTGNTVP